MDSPARRMLYRLAEDLGIALVRSDNYPDTHGLERQMSMPQFFEWMDYYAWKAEERREAEMAARSESNRRRARGMIGS